MEKLRALIDNKLSREKIVVAGEQFNGKKERSHKLTRPLSKMLPTFYQTLLQKYFSRSQLITLKMLVWLLQNQKQVKIERLAATLPLPIQQNSRGRHLQRFLNLDALSVVLLWFPLIEEILKRHLKPGGQLIVALDRTQWKENNVLMVSAIYQKRALPIF